MLSSRGWSTRVNSWLPCTDRPPSGLFPTIRLAFPIVLRYVEDVETTPGLSSFRRLLSLAQAKIRALACESVSTGREISRLERLKGRWERRGLLRWLLPRRLARLQQDLESRLLYRGVLLARWRLSRLKTQIQLPRACQDAYAQVLQSFASLVNCERKWSTLTRSREDRELQRATATVSLDLKSVVFHLGGCELIEHEAKVPHIDLARGGDLFLYPGFLLLLESAERFALLDVRDVEINAAPLTYPAEVVGLGGSPSDKLAWKKTDENGPPERPLSRSSQDPILKHGRLTITGPGLREEFVLGELPAVERFATDWLGFKEAIAGVVGAP